WPRRWRPSGQRRRRVRQPRRRSAGPTPPSGSANERRWSRPVPCSKGLLRAPPRSRGRCPVTRLRYGRVVSEVKPAARVPTIPGLSQLSVLARGGFATIYRAIQDSIGREVAVKVENRTLESERDQRRFLREARAAGQMSAHPYVVDLHDVGVTEDQHPYMIME